MLTRLSWEASQPAMRNNHHDGGGVMVSCRRRRWVADERRRGHGRGAMLWLWLWLLLLLLLPLSLLVGLVAETLVGVAEASPLSMFDKIKKHHHHFHVVDDDAGDDGAEEAAAFIPCAVAAKFFPITLSSPDHLSMGASNAANATRERSRQGTRRGCHHFAFRADERELMVRALRDCHVAEIPQDRARLSGETGTTAAHSPDSNLQLPRPRLRVISVLSGNAQGPQGEQPWLKSKDEEDSGQPAPLDGTKLPLAALTLQLHPTFDDAFFSSDDMAGLHVVGSDGVEVAFTPLHWAGSFFWTYAMPSSYKDADGEEGDGSSEALTLPDSHILVIDQENVEREELLSARLVETMPVPQGTHTAGAAGGDAVHNLAPPPPVLHFLHTCDASRAVLFKELYLAKGKRDVQNISLFRALSLSLLRQVGRVLDTLGVAFWISSGTLLGFYRQCDFIDYSNDVDIGILIDDYHDGIVSALEATMGMTLTHRFGTVGDSFELSFTKLFSADEVAQEMRASSAFSSGDASYEAKRLKLDIFFFYKEKRSGAKDAHAIEDYTVFWNGGTQARTGNKYKYSFTPFELCWASFFDLLVRIPCGTETYIKENYGEEWATPVESWDWKRSPPNVRENGRWEEAMWPIAVQCEVCPNKVKPLE